jgi:hypothetical protein
MEPVSHKYRERIMRMMAVSRGQTLVNERNVNQEGNPELLPFIDGILEENLLPGSGVRGLANLDQLMAASRAGEPCLLLLEHYSNFDLPVFHYLLRKEGRKDIADAVVAIAGIKLNETNPVVTAFTEAYSRLVIYPSRSLEIIKEKYKEPKELVAEIMRSTTVNRAAMKALAVIKTSGKLVLVFPSGTRFRPWDPSTKRAVREIDSYVKSFSRMCLVSINGNILRLNPEGEMHEDLVCQDRVLFEASPVIDCMEFRAWVKSERHHHEDKKQAVADEIMLRLERMHEAAEKDRLSDS